MNDDDLLHTLGAMQKAEIERRAPEWEDVAHGRRSAEDAASAVRAAGTADDEEIALGQALFAPLPATFDEALLDRLAGDRASGSASHPTEAATHHDAHDDRVVARSDRAFWRRTGLGIGLAAAAAALVLVVVRSGTPGGTEPSGISPGMSELRALPAFELGVAAVRASVRADHDADALEVAAGDAVELMLRPASRHGETAKVWSCLEARGGTRTALATEIVDATAGATIVARATIPSGATPGSWTLVAVVATDRPAEDPCAVVDDPTHRVLRAPIVIAARP